VFKIGDKVVPINKSAGCPLQLSTVWANAKKNNQQFLYIVDIEEYVYVVSDTLEDLRKNDREPDGDYFKESDLTLYISQPKYLTTGQVIDTLKVGQKAYVINNIGYKSHLIRVPANSEHTGGFEWRYTYPNGTTYEDWFSIDDEILGLLWEIRE
jgi:hypothetical protein